MIASLKLEETATKLGYSSIWELRKAFSYEIQVPACCRLGCLVDPNEKCEHGNPSIFSTKDIVVVLKL